MSIIDRIITALSREAEAGQQTRTQAQPSVAWPTADERRADAVRMNDWDTLAGGR